uniref:Uncharacterized protein n=1 Tax=Podoviridae sp. cttxo15 TaxID=2826584 RepID=A0A8S5N276_9CAUD|nr:MAG TPA: hypothetical protein [Podoviridae sp. cttxo15]
MFTIFLCIILMILLCLIKGCIWYNFYSNRIREFF